MRAEILTIGDELCRGEIVDTNAAWLAQALWGLDVSVAWMTSCRDLAPDMRQALRTASERAEVVLVSGGLGPTEDDRTVEVVADLVGCDLVVHEPSRRRMEERFEKAGFALTVNNLRQVRTPASARVLENPVGQAPGFEVALDGTPVFCMPGVPSELRAIFDGGVRERIAALREAGGERVERIARRVYRVFGAGESHVDSALAGVLDGSPGASLHFRVAFPEVLVSIVVRDPDAGAARARLEALDGPVRARLGHKLYGVGDDSLPAAVGRALRSAGATVATAESCTGGLIGALLTDVAGSSQYFTGGAITYSNEEKTRQLGVDPEILATHGAVSEACVLAMSAGARARFGTTYAVAVSGVAGPGGGTADKPVGTVWLAVAGPDGGRARRMFWPGSRERVRTLTAHWALAMLLRAVRDDAGASGASGARDEGT